MAKLSKEDILKLAQLARLKLSNNEVEQFQTEISEILGYVEMLNDVDTGSLKPTYQVTGLTNVTRMDEIKDYGISQLELLKNVPKTEKSYIKVNKVL